MLNNGKVIFGVMVIIMNLEIDKEIMYCIVGDDEVNIKENFIFVNLFIVCGLIGKELDDVVNIQMLVGIVEYEIVEVEYI